MPNRQLLDLIPRTIEAFVLRVQEGVNFAAGSNSEVGEGENRGEAYPSVINHRIESEQNEALVLRGYFAGTTRKGEKI
jgi:hypothetical protein